MNKNFVQYEETLLMAYTPYVTKNIEKYPK